MKKPRRSNFLFFWIAMIGVLGMVSCDNGYRKCPKANSRDMILDKAFSQIFLPLSANVNELEKLIGSKIPDTLFADDNVGDYQVKVQIEKTGRPSLDAFGRAIRITIPLSILVEKDIMISTVKGEGSLFLELLTNVEIDEQWNLLTNTRIEKVTWEKEPSLNIFGAKVHIKGYVNDYLKKSESFITQQVDDFISENQPVKQWVEESMVHFKRSYAVDPDRNLFLQIIPVHAGISSFENVDGQLKTRLLVKGDTRLLEDSSETRTDFDLPTFMWSDGIQQEYELKTTATLQESEIQDLLRRAAVGQTFKYKGKETTITKVDFALDAQRVHTKIEMEGYLNGDVKFSGIPVWNEDQLQFCNQDLELNIKSGLSKMALWLAKKKISKTLLKEMESYMEAESNKRIKEINDFLHEFQMTDNIDLKAEIYKHSLDPIIIDGKTISTQLNIGLRGKMNIDGTTIYLE